VLKSRLFKAFEPLKIQDKVRLFWPIRANAQMSATAVLAASMQHGVWPRTEQPLMKSQQGAISASHRGTGDDAANELVSITTDRWKLAGCARIKWIGFDG
jgi:hypothetical protein